LNQTVCYPALFVCCSVGVDLVLLLMTFIIKVVSQIINPTIPKKRFSRSNTPNFFATKKHKHNNKNIINKKIETK